MKTIWWGIGLSGLSLMLFIALLVVVIAKQDFGVNLLADAVLYVDVAGRITVDGTLQAEGPTAIPVSAGEHVIVFVDQPPQTPTHISIKDKEFYYLPDPVFFSTPPSDSGAIVASVFPPDTVVSILGCKQCVARHNLFNYVVPGTYIVQFENPSFKTHQETVTVKAAGVAKVPFSFITTTEQWEAWSTAHIDVLPQPGYRRRSVDGLFLPFEIGGAILKEIFN